MNQRTLTLEVLPEAFAVAQLERDAEAPAWVQGESLVSVTRTRTELSVICPETSVPSEVKAQRGFRCLRIQGPLAFDEVGVLASLAEPLSRAGISIFTISTYDTDYLLVTRADLDAAVSTLEEVGHAVRPLGAA